MVQVRPVIWLMMTSFLFEKIEDDFAAHTAFKEGIRGICRSPPVAPPADLRIECTLRHQVQKG